METGSAKRRVQNVEVDKKYAKNMAMSVALTPVESSGIIDPKLAKLLTLDQPTSFRASSREGVK